MPEFMKLPLIAVLGIGSLALFVMAHLVLIAVCEVVLVLAAIAWLCVLRRRALVVHDVPEHIAALTAGAALASQRQASDAPALHLQAARRDAR